MFAVLLLGLVVGLLAHGPIAIDGLGPRIAAVLQDRFGRGAVFVLGTTSLIKRGFGPSFGIDGLSVRGPDGQKVLSAPRAEVSIDPLPLLYGKVVPKRLEVLDVELRLVLLKNGNLAVAAGDGSKPFFELTRGSEEAPTSAGSPIPEKPPAASPGAAPAVPLAAPTPPRRAAAMQQAAKGVRLLLDAITDPESPLAAVDRLGVKRGKLVIEDQTSDEEVVYRDLDLEFNKASDGTTLDVSARGPSQRWTIQAKASGRPGAERHFQIDVNDLSQDELQLAAGTRTLGFDSDIPVSMTFKIGLTASNALSEAVATFRLGSGFLRLEDPDQEPFLIERCSGGFHWDAATRKIQIDRTLYDEGSTRFVVGGSVTPPLNEGQPWAISVATTEAGVLGPDRLGQKPVVIDSGAFNGRLFPERKQMIIDGFTFGSGGEGGLAMTGQIDWDHGPRVRLGASIAPTSVRVAQRVWPAFAASPIRAWLLSHFEDGTLQTGTLRVDYDGDALMHMRSDRAPPDESIALDFSLTKARLAFLPGVPPLQDVSGTGHITGRTTHFNLTSGALETNGRRIAISDGSFVVEDSDRHPVPAAISMHVSGSVDAISDIMSRDALKAYASLPLDPATLKGQVDGRMEERLMLGEHDDGKAAEPELRINATVTNFSADKLIGKEKLDNASLTLNVDPAGMKASGQGRIAGVPATFEINRSGDKAPDALITMTLDDAARAKMGLSAIPGLSGPVSGRVAVSALGQAQKMKAQVELDLGKAAVTAALVGLSKPAGKPAKITFGLSPGESRTLVDPLVVDVGSLQARGSVEVGGDNSFQGAHFSLIKFSQGDDMKLDVAKADDTFKLTIRGSTIDARPFLRALTQLPSDAGPLAKNGKADKREAEMFKGFDVDLKSGILTGFNKEVLSDVDLKLSKRGAQIQRFAVQGKFGRNALFGAMAPSQRMRLTTQDAGALVSFIDLYKHMEGGQLTANLAMGDDTMNGNLEIQGFTLRDEPAMKKLVAQSVTSSQPGDSASTAARSVDANAVGFTKLKVNFQRDGSRIELKDATMYGPAIGLSVDGWLDYVHDRVGMTGTFVPAFAVNNLFSQVPVLGFFLGGASNEGLFAINFKISGSAASPSLSVNPLSAIAPGFLRKIFGALDPGVPTGDPGVSAVH